MGNRYVWEKFNKSYKYNKKYVSNVGYNYVSSYTVYLGDEYAFDEKTGEYKVSGTTKRITASSSSVTESAYTYPYAAIDRNPSDLMLYCSNGGGKLWLFRTNSGTDPILSLVLNSNVSSAIQYPTDSRYMESRTSYTSEKVDIKGPTSYGLVTSDKQNAYTSGVNGNYWFSSLGSDIIDASAVSYSTDKPERGKPVTITVTPSTGKKYGGTVYYQYYYSTGGSWISLGNKTTETSKTMTIPADAKTFQVRVLASDDLGFTSTTYTTGAKLEVQSIQAYTGVSGTARRVTKMYIGVNGIAREVTGGYTGVNGKARKWF